MHGSQLMSEEKKKNSEWIFQIFFIAHTKIFCFVCKKKWHIICVVSSSQPKQYSVIFLCNPETPKVRLMGSRDFSTLGVSEMCFQALVLQVPQCSSSHVLYDQITPEERTCLSEAVQSYSKVAQEVLYVEIPNTKSVKGLGGIMFSKCKMCKSLL